jgi:hypothetical protein
LKRAFIPKIILTCTWWNFLDKLLSATAYHITTTVFVRCHIAMMRIVDIRNIEGQFSAIFLSIFCTLLHTIHFEGSKEQGMLICLTAIQFFCCYFAMFNLSKFHLDIKLCIDDNVMDGTLLFTMTRRLRGNYLPK